jgi:hypothetical protein
MIEEQIGQFKVEVSTCEMKGHNYVTLFKQYEWDRGIFLSSEKEALSVAKKVIARQLASNEQFGGTLNAPDYW